MAKYKDFRRPIATYLKNKLKKEFNYVGLQVQPIPERVNPILSFEIIDTMNPFELPNEDVRTAAKHILNERAPANRVYIRLATKKRHKNAKKLTC